MYVFPSYQTPKMLKSATRLRKKNYFVVLHCVKYPRMWAFSDPHLPMYGQNRIRIFPYMDWIIDSYQEALNINNEETNEETKQRKRKIIWFNKNVLTKVGNQFLKLINKFFPRNHKFYKLSKWKLFRLIFETQIHIQIHIRYFKSLPIVTYYLATSKK